MNNNRTWEALSMKDRASFIKLAVQNGYRNIRSIRSLYNSNKYDDGGPTNDYNAILYNGEIIAPIEEISVTGNSGLTNYKPGTKEYINQIRKFTDRIYNGDLAIDTVPEYYRKGVQNTLRGDQFANKVRQSRNENYKGLMTAMNAIPLAVGAQAILPAIPIDKVIKVSDKVGNLYTKLVPKSVRSGVKAAWEGFSLYDTIDNLDYRIEASNNAFKEGKIGKGLFNTALTLTDLIGVGSGINDISQLGKTVIKNLPPLDMIDITSPNMPSFLRNYKHANKVNYIINSWLDRPSKISTYLLNKKFPEEVRKEVWERVVDYNNMQRMREGLEPLNIPYNEKVIKAPSRLDEYNNLIGKKTDFSTGPGKALAWSIGNITDPNYDIKIAIPTYFTNSKYLTPRGIGAHEIRHGVQKTFGNNSLGFKKAKNQLMLSDFSDRFDLAPFYGGTRTAKEAEILANSKYKTNRKTWVKSLPEFDAEMSLFREIHKLDTPYHKWEYKMKELFDKFASARFGISQEEAHKIATGLSNKGYSLGGPLYNEDNPIESFQGNPYIPVVRY